ncbi:ABC transporter substrate-binding protein [Curtobacterium sp. MCBD17_034]|uniref:ABC transporter substrate-binding protein n=1 Tax=unclassified Curtobacterium TaxID=257496 RepID=UPI000DA760E7|nr:MULTISPECIES: ABC transporter substrate-binding protein [unclassified Curtobacterium]PZF59299.1 ABC transporter substrate-binding protein [Curtobacterium sp. MCBD17_034]PZM34161.1 ABC transporter substrate-binding protein [Curtobacterium sp. MCBD17_031]
MRLSSLRRRTRIALVAAAAVPLLALAACSGGGGSSTNAAPKNGTLTVGLLGDIGQPPDPDIYYANNGLAIVLNTYEGLVQYADDTDSVKIAPRLATSWTVSGDNTVYTFHLRKGVTFHDGTPFTSAAVKVAFDRRIAVKGGAAYMVQGVKSVATPDASTAVVTLDAPNSAFLDYLASPFGPKMESPTALQKHAGSDDAQTYLQTHDVGTGPYEISSADPGTSWTLSRYAGYWGTKSPFTTVKLPIYSDVSALQLAFDRGDVSAIVAALPSSSLSKYEDSKQYASYMLPTLQSALVTVNPTKSFFSSKQARLAFLESIDQKSIVKQVLGSRSEPATTLYAKGMIPGGKDEQTITYEPSAMKSYAKTLPSGTTMTIGYASGNTNAQQMANIQAAKLQADGITATAKSYPTSQVFGWINDPTTGPDAFFDGNNGPDGGSPYMWGHVFWDKSGGIDYFGCDVPAVDQKLDHAVQTGDDSEYVAAAEQYAQTGCYYNLSYNKDWVVAQKWLTGVAKSHNIGANELDFSKLGIAG